MFKFNFKGRKKSLTKRKRSHIIPLAAIEKTITGAVGNILEQIKLFDVYRGAPVPAGKKSVAYSLVLRAADRTLTVEECDKAIEKALKALSQYGITLRA